MSEESNREPKGVRRSSFVTVEQLDRALHVTTPKAWMALGTLMAMLVAVAFWSVFGELGTHVTAEGIILSRGGMVVDVPASRNGMLTGVLVDVGDRVEQDQVVAEMYDPELTRRHRDAIALMEETRDELRRHEQDIAGQLDLLAQTVAGERARTDTLRQVAQSVIEDARRHLANVRMLEDEQVVSRASVQAAEQEVNAARRDFFDVMTRRDQLEDQALDRRVSLEETLHTVEAEYAAARREVNEIAATMEEWRVRSPLAGHVAEVKNQIGASLAAGQAVLSVETGAEGLDVRIFVSPGDGKRVKDGMPVLVSPRNAKREEYGAMIGTVASISEFPASLPGIVSVLHNEDLAASFASDGPPYAGRVALEPDSTTVSGFAWTSARGNDVDITSGTMATVEVVVDLRPPVTLALPWLRGLLAR